MNYLATTHKWLLAFVLFTAPTLVVAQPTSEIHDTGSVMLEVFDDAELGTFVPGFAGTGFTFAGFNDDNSALFSGIFLVGQSQTQVSGQSYHSGDGPATGEWVADGGFSTLTPPFAEPFEEFDEGYEVSFTDVDAATPIGLDVVMSSYSLTDDDYVVLEYIVENTSGGDLSDIYIGIFADMDVGAAGANVGDYDAAGRVAHVHDPVGTGFFGVAALDTAVPVSGWNVNVTGPPGMNPPQDSLWIALTTAGADGSTPADKRLIIGQGPYDIATGASVVAHFAMVAGSDETDIVANSMAAAAAVEPVAIEPGPDGVPGTHNLSTIYPNPFNPQANFTLEVAEQQSVRVAVYDALGREVATLFNGTLTAGTEHAFVIDGAGLPSGVYMVRAIGEQFTAVRRVTLMK